MKRNTTPTLPVKICMPFKKVERIEFIFKEKNQSDTKPLLHKILNSDEIKLQDGDISNSFIVLLTFTTEETMQLPSGLVYMDTRIVLQGGLIPETKIVSLSIKETLFEEVFKND